MKTFIIKAAALLPLFAVVACSEDALVENMPIANNDGTIKEINITGKDFQFEGGTRSSVSISESGASFLWDEDDVVGIFPNKGDQVSFAMDGGSGTQTATFSGGGWALKSLATYAAYYPHVYENRDMTKIPVSYLGQIQIGNANTDHIGAYDFMAASVATPSNGTVAFDMQHLGCLVQLKIDLLKEASFDNITINYGNSYNTMFTTIGYIDLTSETPKINTIGDKSSSIDIKLNNLRVKADETAVIYFMMAPTNMEGKNIDIVVKENNGLTRTFQVKGKNFLAGKAYSYSMTNPVTSPGAVDLGLSVKWANCNVGAESPEEYGEYFAWGSVKEADYYSADYSVTHDLCISELESRGIISADGNLTAAYDAATENWDGNWRMPTLIEMEELLNNCNWEWITQNGVYGSKVTGPNGNSIFLPAAGAIGGRAIDYEGTIGFYWSATPPEGKDDYGTRAYALRSSSDDNNNIYGYYRFTGFSIRPVSE